MSNFISTDVEFQFIQAIQEVGIPAPEVVIGDGKLHRFSSGRRRRDQNGWYVLHLDRRPSGSFGCWKRGISETWHVRKDSPRTTPQQNRELRRQMERDQRQRQTEVERGHRTAAERAAELWSSLKPAPVHHPYLARKMITPCGARVTIKNWLALPILDFDGRLCSVQFVAPNGQKRMFSGARKKGCFIPVSAPEDLQNEDMPLAIVEGFATGASVAKDNPDLCVIAGIDAGNLRNVCIGARLLWLGRTITIFGDDDRKSPTNPGRTAATEAAKVAGCELLFPDFPPAAPDHLSDYNDLHCWLARGSANE